METKICATCGRELTLDLYWYSELDDRCRTKIVERANEIYNK